MNKWQPIETAPKTSRHILVWTPANLCCSLVYWADDGGWKHAFGKWRLHDEPTHWMPLPDSPAAEGASGAAAPAKCPVHANQAECRAFADGEEDPELQTGTESGSLQQVYMSDVCPAAWESEEPAAPGGDSGESGRSPAAPIYNVPAAVECDKCGKGKPKPTANARAVARALRAEARKLMAEADFARVANPHWAAGVMAAVADLKATARKALGGRKGKR